MTAAGSWKAAISDLPLDGTTYKAEEGTGTFNAADGTCADFEAKTAFVINGNNYGQVSVTYTDVADSEGHQETDKIKANTVPSAGSVAFVNQVSTKITVKKVWEGEAPSKGIVIKLVSSDETKAPSLFVELNADNKWTHTFDAVPVVTGITYTVLEGKGTVDENGTCTNFQAYDGDFRIGNKGYKQISIVYENADGTARSQNNLDGTVSPDAGTATITNQYMYMLPGTGGFGLAGNMILGGSVAGLFLVLILFLRRKRV